MPVEFAGPSPVFSDATQSCNQRSYRHYGQEGVVLLKLKYFQNASVEFVSRGVLRGFRVRVHRSKSE